MNKGQKPVEYEKLDVIFEPLGKLLKKHKPENIEEFVLNWIRETYGYRASQEENDRLELEFLRQKVPTLELELKEGSSQNIPHLREHFGRFQSIDIIAESDSDSESDSEDEDSTLVIPQRGTFEELTVEQVLSKETTNLSKFSISGEAYGKYNKKSSFKPEHINKDKDVRDRLKQRLKGHWIFQKLPDSDKVTLVDWMRQEFYKSGDIIIKEDDSGHSLFIVDNGTFNWVKNNADGAETLLKVYEEGEVFGELALMYNCLRTATIIANEDDWCVFSLDRQTFNYIVSDSSTKRNAKYMQMLAKVPILKTIDQYERSKIIDACTHVEYKKDKYVIIEGEEGEEFFILLEGEAYATKLIEANEDPIKVKDYKAGDYFGERALLKNTTRAANIIAKTDIKCLVLNRESFIKLLGPVEHILKRNMEIYINYMD